MTIASIDLVILNDLIRRMTDAAGALMSSAGQIKRTSTGVLGGASQTATINQAAGWVNDQLPGLRRRLALAQQIENQAITFGQRAAGQRGIVKIDESLLSTLPPDQARALGADAAKQVNGAHSTLSPELIAVLAKNQNDPYFALGFAGNADLKQVSWALRLASRERERIIAESGPKSAELEQWKVQYTSLVTGLGTTLGTATRDLEGVGLPPGFAEKYADAITEGKTRSSTPSDVAYGQGQSLSMLLPYGRFSTKFLDTVSTKVYDYEYAHKEDPVWEPRSYWEPYHSFAGAYQPDGKAMPDPMANILEALSHNPQSAQNFFDVANSHAAPTTVEINGQQVVVNNRLKYLLQDRTWHYDNGDGLGNALQTATTTWRDRTDNGRTSATIASQTFALMGQQVGQGKDGGWFMGLNEKQGWEPGMSMRDSLAHMFASYAPDLIRVAGVPTLESDDLTKGWIQKSDKYAPDEGQFFPSDGPLGATMDANSLKNLLKLIGADEGNVMIVSVGVLAAGQLLFGQGLAAGLAKDPGNAVKLLTGHENSPAADAVAGQLANTLSEVMNDAYLGDSADQAFQKRKAEAVSRALGLALKLPIIPAPKGPWTGLLLDNAKSAVLDAIAKGPKQDADEVWNAAAASGQTRLRDLAMTSLLDAGYFAREVYAGANTPQAPDKFVPPPNAAFKLGPDGHPVEPLAFDFTSRAYTNWAVRAQQAPMKWINLSVILPYRLKFPAL
ncbi:hypothetical protein GCM10029976_013940 [Kribbella albertanoniae]|uniref:Uncharacterized protein n=1 Tax=Kribbella albertanoniae TaxID=1266829 RepID=A0A4R4QCD6_9ACTN|nr:hypothetical protein [Kribbella albertanoniae]TDC33064.1 hypothetical protein E1261_07050 [Kribbella albertanoniae]